MLQADRDLIRLRLSCDADPAFYDLPLTLSTVVPSSWQTCVVRQGKLETKVQAADGTIRYPAVPGSEEITIKP